jgi:hypothetical protein
MPSMRFHLHSGASTSACGTYEVQQVARSGGTIPIEEWVGRVVAGDEKA